MSTLGSLTAAGGGGAPHLNWGWHLLLWLERQWLLWWERQLWCLQEHLHP